MATLTIDITKEDIEAAKAAKNYYKMGVTASYARAESCPIAQALKRKYPEYTPWVFGNHAVIRNEFGWLVADLRFPEHVIEFIMKADDEDDNVNPTTLTFVVGSEGQGL